MLTWLNRYTLPDSGRHLWEHVHSHHGRAVVTDGRCMLAVDDPGASFGPLAEAVRLSPRVVLDRVTAFLDHPAPADASHTTLSDLWFWLDRLERMQCPACRPFRRGDPEREFCSGCDGDGWVFPWRDSADKDTGVVAGVHLDRNRLCWWLAGELEGFGAAVRYWRHKAHAAMSQPAVVFDGGGWRLAVMSLDPTFHPGRYREYLPGAGVWWHHRRDGVARCAAADYYAERGIEADNLFAGTEGVTC